MPCRSDYLEPNTRERELQRAARLLIYVYGMTGHDIPEALSTAAKNIYCTADYVPELCAAIKRLSPDLVNMVLYNGRSKHARDLADWWEEHLEADREREERELEEAIEKDGRLLTQILIDRMRSMTPEQRKAYFDAINAVVPPVNVEQEDPYRDANWGGAMGR